jgi:hypothetical protein
MSPALFILLIFWAMCEFIGYVEVKLAWRPALLATVTIAAVGYFANGSLPGVLMGIVCFFLLAPVIDKSLLGDIHKISSIKNVQKGAT